MGGTNVLLKRGLSRLIKKLFLFQDAISYLLGQIHCNRQVNGLSFGLLINCFITDVPIK